VRGAKCEVMLLVIGNCLSLSLVFCYLPTVSAFMRGELSAISEKNAIIEL